MAAETASGLAATHTPAGPGAAGIRAQAGAVARRSVTRTLRQRRLLILPVAFPLILFAINSSSLASASRLQGFPPVSYRAFALAVPFLLGSMLIAVTAGTDLAQDIQSGFLNRLALTPLRPGALLAGQLGGAIIVAAVQAVLYLAVGLAAGVGIAAGALGAVLLLALSILGRPSPSPIATPALLTSTSSAPASSLMRTAAALTLSASVTSRLTSRTSPSPASSFAADSPRSWSRHPSQTVKPSCASWRAVSNPMPLLAPVTSAVCLAVFMSSMLQDQDGMIHNVKSPILYASSTKGSPLGSSDPVADAIGLLRPRAVVEAGLHAAGPWAVRFDPFPHVKLGGVVRGECWLVLQGHEPVLLREGDFYLLGNPPTYVLASALTEEPRDAKPLWDSAANGAVRIGPEAGEGTYLCGGHFSFDDTNASILIDVLPPLVHVRAADPRGKLLAHLSELLVTEVETTAVGGSLVLDHLAQILFVHMLRAHAGQAGRPAGWLGALSDDGIGAALRAMHADVAHRWTLKELASISCMSRSAFAASFKNQVGTAPLEYLIEWRMSLARDALRRGTRSISELASATGYESESAFSTAFRRVTGSSPKQFRDTAHRAVNSEPAQESLAGSRAI